MSMLIACLLIYQLNLEWWWYGVAFACWWGHLLFHSALAGKL